MLSVYSAVRIETKTEAFRLKKSPYIRMVSAYAVGEIGSFHTTGLAVVDWPTRSLDLTPIHFYL